MSNINEIKAKLWEMANSLRGKMDASEYKNYILPFMFYRYLSENQDRFLKENMLEEYYDLLEKKVDKPRDGENDTKYREYIQELEEYLDEICEGIGYAINPEFTWNNIVSMIENHKIKASDFQDMFDSFNQNARRNQNALEDFEGVFSDVNIGDSRLGNNTNERARALNEIIIMINDFTFKDDGGRDVLGDVYQYMIGQFAANAGKKGGEFYTPHEVSRVLSKIVTHGVEPSDNQFRVYDPTMGSGSLLLTVQKELPGGNREGSVDFYGQESNQTTYNLARMNLMMHGVNYKNMMLKSMDTLAYDWPEEEKDGVDIPMIFDAIVANPPYSHKWDIKGVDREKDSRFKGYGIAPASKAEYAFVLHGLYHLDSKGTMAIVLPHGVLFRGASEAKIRKNLIDNNLLDCVIGLPANLFYGTSIPTCIMVFKGREAKGENRDVLFIDASNDFEKAKNKNILTDKNIDRIISTYINREEVEKYAHLATLDEIKENDYNLNIPRYVDTYEEEEVTPLPELANEMVRLKKEIEETRSNLFELLMELEGTTEESKKELEKFIELIGEK